jgi:hypothetical protein
MPKEIAAFIARVLQCCLDVRQVWLVSQDEAAAAAPRWELLVFGSSETLKRLRRADNLHRSDIDVLVVTDGEHFENAWGPRQLSGSLARWGWRAASAGEAYYDEAKWAGEEGAVVRVRRRAALLWSRSANLTDNAQHRPGHARAAV